MAQNVKVAARYGTIEITGYEGSARLEIYHPADGSKPTRERRHCAGPGDVTGPRSTEPGNRATGYDPGCGWCWLGYGHTEAAHAGRVGGAK